MKYKIYPTLYSEIRKGTVWSFFETDSNLIKIKNLENKKSIVVSHRKIDENFIKIYNQSDFTNKLDIKNKDVILFDEYYRNKLCVEKYSGFKLQIKPVKCFWNKLAYLSNHSDDIVKISFWFAFLTFLFSFITYFLPFSKLCDCVAKIISQFN
jgi:hypothetical protein